jgi:DNA repair exonuclease SbcCD nuclease subunit
MKHLIVTDTHLGIYNASDLWHSIVLNLFKDIKETSKEHNINSILHLGDFFHNRKEINTKTLDVAQFIMEEILADFKVNIVIGNHDSYYKNKLFPNSLQVFKDIKNVNIIKECEYLKEDKNIMLCPWSHLPNETKDVFLFGHFEIKGFLMNSSYRCKSGINKNDLRDFRHVYSGHFHTPSGKGNVTYLGSPYGLTWHDINSKRGYYIFDSSKGEMNFIEYNNAPKYVIVETENIIEENIKGNFIKLLFNRDYGHIENQKIVDSVSNMGPLSLQPDFSNFVGTEEKQENETLEIMNHKDITKEYINKIELPDHINKQTLLNFMEKLMI